MDGSGGQAREKDPVAFQFSATFFYIPWTEVTYCGERKQGRRLETILWQVCHLLVLGSSS